MGFKHDLMGFDACWCLPLGFIALEDLIRFSFEVFMLSSSSGRVVSGSGIADVHELVVNVDLWKMVYVGLVHGLVSDWSRFVEVHGGSAGDEDAGVVDVRLKESCNSSVDLTCALSVLVLGH